MEKCRNPLANSIDYYTLLSKSLGQKMRFSDPYQNTLRERLGEAEKLLRELTGQVNEIVNQSRKDIRDLWLTKKKILKYIIKEGILYSQKLVKLKKSEKVESEILETQTLPVIGDAQTVQYTFYKDQVIYAKKETVAFLDTLRKGKKLKNHLDQVSIDHTYCESKIQPNIHITNYFEIIDLKS